MRRMMLNLVALATICGGAQHLSAQESTWRCCEAYFGAVCCGSTCSAGWFYCRAALG